MTADDSPEQRLERLGSDPGPEVDGAFANRLEADLRSAMVERSGVGSARTWWQPAIVTAAIIFALVAGISTWRADRDVVTEVVMTAATDTEVVIGEAISSGRAGLELPDGARILVGPDGQATVGGIVLPAGTVAVIVDGHVEIIGDDSTAVSGGGSSPPSSPSSTASPTTDGSGATRASDQPEASPGRPSATAPPSDGAGSTISAPSRTSSPTTVRTSTTAPSSTTPSSTTGPTSTVPDGSATSAPPGVVLDLAHLGGGQLEVSWTIAPVAGVVAFRVEAVVGDRVSTLVVIRDSGARTAVVEQLEPRAGYRVVALGPEGVQLAVSEIVVPA